MTGTIVQTIRLIPRLSSHFGTFRGNARKRQIASELRWIRDFHQLDDLSEQVTE